MFVDLDIGTRETAPRVYEKDTKIELRSPDGSQRHPGGRPRISLRYESAPWLDGLSQRLDIANALARRMGGDADPRELFEQTLGPLASTQTREDITRAESRPQALALLFMSPNFQRR